MLLLFYKFLSVIYSSVYLYITTLSYLNLLLVVNISTLFVAPNINTLSSKAQQSKNDIQPVKNDIQPVKERKDNTPAAILDDPKQKKTIVEKNETTNNIVFLIPLLTTLLIGLSVLIFYRINRKT